MDNLVNILLLVVILLNFFLLGSSRLKACIQTVAVQGGMLSYCPFLAMDFPATPCF